MIGDHRLASAYVTQPDHGVRLDTYYVNSLVPFDVVWESGLFRPCPTNATLQLLLR